MSRIFVPLIDNGTGNVKAQYCYDALAALSGRNIAIARVSQPYPTRSMNMATGVFLASNCDEMLVIDMDIGFTREQVDMLLSHDVPLVYGIYPKKTIPYEPCLATFTDGNPFGGRESLVEVKRAGRGFMRVKREVFDRMKSICPHYANHGRDEWQFWHEGVNEAGEWVSEDWQFCDNWRALGGRVLVDQRINLLHYGDFPYGKPLPSIDEFTETEKAA